MLASARPRGATKEDLARLKSFLRENGLPEVGAERWIENFIIIENESGDWIGVAGAEFYGESGLLRSIAVDKQFRGRGHGQILVNAMLVKARNKGIKIVYLLTEDGESYFKHRGFQIAKREDVDDVVKTSLEFTEACSERALVMRKVIG